MFLDTLELAGGVPTKKLARTKFRELLKKLGRFQFQPKLKALKGIEYCVTFVERNAALYDLERGVVVDTRTSVIAAPYELHSDSIVGLLNKIGEHFPLDVNKVIIPQPEQKTTGSISFERLEPLSADEADEADVAKWKEGEIKLYAAAYHFSVERRLVDAINVDDLKATGVGVS